VICYYIKVVSQKRGDMMKTLENIILKSCGYTAFILFLFYTAGTIADFTNPYIDFKTFLIIALFGTAISLSELILKLKSFNVFLKVLLHYLVLFCAFTVIFVISGNISSKGPSAIFSSLIIFTFFYAIVFTAVYFIRKAIKKADASIDKRIKAKVKPEKKNSYKKLYEKED
jgi:hypothetical protein